jgi:hypothetical protein
VVGEALHACFFGGAGFQCFELDGWVGGSAAGMAGGGGVEVPARRGFGVQEGIFEAAGEALVGFGRHCGGV